MELNTEDSFCLNVMLAVGVQAVRIDRSSMTVFGLTDKGDASVQLHPTCRHEQYLKNVKQLLADHALDSPEGYPVYLRRWTRMGQLRDENLAKLLLIGEEEAIIAVVHAPGLTDEIARRAWWAMPTIENARRMLEKEQVARGVMGPVLAEFLIEHLPFEESPTAIMETVRWLLHYDLVTPENQITLWNRGRDQGAYYIGFLEQRADTLPKQLPARADYAAYQLRLQPLLDKQNPFALELSRLLSGPGQSFLSGCEEFMQRPGTHEIVTLFLQTVANYFARLAGLVTKAPSLEQWSAANQTLSDVAANALKELRDAVPELKPEVDAMSMLVTVDHELAAPILRRTTAVNALLRTKLQPVFAPLAVQIRILRGAAPQHRIAAP